MGIDRAITPKPKPLRRRPRKLATHELMTGRNMEAGVRAELHVRGL